jgi:pimeloyl-ACP methyl ester carboxylesterase
MLLWQKTFVLGLIILANIFLLHMEIIVDNSYSIEQRNHSSTNHIDIPNLKEIEPRKVQVGDIEIAYKMFGTGSPILLINGFAAPMDFWDPILLEHLSTNHTVIMFDNRGIGNTTSGEKTFSIEQFANDTAGLLDTLKLKKVDVMGWSMGGMIAQELALLYPDKIDKLIIYASTCGGKESIPPSQEVQRAAATISTESFEKIQKFLPLLFPDAWRMQNPNYLEKLPKTTEVIPNDTLNRQTEAIVNWEGVCDKIDVITQPTLVVGGTNDVFTPPGNSLLITEKIEGSWLVQIKEGGHGLMFQYPETFSKILQTFLSS